MLSKYEDFLKMLSATAFILFQIWNYYVPVSLEQTVGLIEAFFMLLGAGIIMFAVKRVQTGDKLVEVSAQTIMANAVGKTTVNLQKLYDSVRVLIGSVFATINIFNIQTPYTEEMFYNLASAIFAILGVGWGANAFKRLVTSKVFKIEKQHEEQS